MLTLDDLRFISEEMSKRVGYHFNNPDLLIQALTRKSAKGVKLPKDAPDFEALEFIGDRALNLAIASHVQELHSDESVKILQEYYVKYTRNTDDSKRNGGPLYRVAKELGLEPFIIKSDTVSLSQHGERGKKLGGKKTKEWHLADHMEAILGAMYQDSGHDMRVIDQFVRNYWGHMGLNEEQLSESSFGNSLSTNARPATLKQLQQSTLFLEKSKAGNWPEAKAALERGALVNIPDEKGRTALHFFSMRGNLKAIKELLDQGAYIDARDTQGWTAIFYAADASKNQAVQLLLEEGACIDIVLENDATVLSLGAKRGNQQIVDLLLSQYLHMFSMEQLARAQSAAEENPVTHAAIQVFFKKAQEKQAKNRILFNAVESWLSDEENSQKFQMIKDAIIVGADIRSRNAQGQTIFHLLSQHIARFDLLRFILKNVQNFDGIKLDGVATLFGEDASNQQFTSTCQGITSLQNLSFKGANLSGTSFDSVTQMTGINFSHANLSDVVFNENTLFIGVNFHQADLMGARLQLTNMDADTLSTLSEDIKIGVLENTVSEKVSGSSIPTDVTHIASGSREVGIFAHPRIDVELTVLENIPPIISLNLSVHL